MIAVYISSFAIKTLRHTSTSSVKTTIFYIMKTLYNLNDDMHAHNYPSIPYVNPFIPFIHCTLSFHSF